MTVSEINAYERDPRITRLETDVVANGEAEGHPFVVLADTILYPEGGGQPADRGTIAGVAVLDVQKKAGMIRHILDGPAPAGRVAVELDWVRRFDHMQQHTGQHLLTAMADRIFGWHTTAFHLGERICDVEVDAPRVEAGQLAELEEAVATEIRAGRPVLTRRVSREEYAEGAMDVRSRGLPEGHTGDVRLVEIEGIDLNTCGGTHCSSTAQIEALKLLGSESMRGGTRLFWVAGGRLRRLHETHHLRNAELRELLGASDDELVVRVATKLEQLKEAERSVRALEEALALASAVALVTEQESLLVAHWPERDLPFLQRVAREAGRLAPDRAVFLTAGEEAEGAFLVAAGEATDLNVPALGSKVAEVLGGRGGGSGRIFQGKAGRLSRRGEAADLLREAVGQRE
ncbi:MAG: alanyl-tRNA editing protein [Gemmatimonadetes bacterium]|nr:alanyl-tRNA editing protein [Gemmatimonadota bacterium]